MAVILKANLRAWRTANGLTIGQRAKQIGLSPHAYSIAERGGKPSYEAAVFIARFYGKTLDEIWEYRP